MIHWSSIEADMIATADVRGPLFENARTKFVIFDCALRCLTVPVDLGGKQKQLGDLMIRNDSKFVEIISELKSKREEWFRVVNARGSIVPGQSFAPSTAVMGRYDLDRRRQGRLWCHQQTIHTCSQVQMQRSARRVRESTRRVS